MKPNIRQPYLLIIRNIIQCPFLCVRTCNLDHIREQGTLLWEICQCDYLRGQMVPKMSETYTFIYYMLKDVSTSQEFFL